MTTRRRHSTYVPMPFTTHSYLDSPVLQEDKRLLEIIHKDQGDPSKDVGQVGNWTKIASDLNNGRSAKQCRDRWLNYLRPGIKKGDWTTEEEDLIRELYETFGAR